MIWPSIYIRFDIRLQNYKKPARHFNTCLREWKLLSLYMFHLIIFLLLIVSSLSCNFNRCAVCFQSFMNIACRSTQNAASNERFLSLHIVIKPLNKKRNMISSLLCWNVTLLMFIQTPWQLAIGWPYCFAKSPRVFRSFWILNECNLHFKIVKYCILSEVCIHSTVSCDV